VLTTAPAKKNTDSKFFHNLSVSTRRKFPRSIFSADHYFPRNSSSAWFEFRRLLELRHVAALIKHDQLGSRNAVAQFLAADHRDQLVLPSHTTNVGTWMEASFVSSNCGVTSPAIMRWIV